MATTLILHTRRKYHEHVPVLKHFYLIGSQTTPKHSHLRTLHTRYFKNQTLH